MTAAGKPAAIKQTGVKTSLLKKSATKEKSLSPEELAEQKARLKAEQEEYERQMEEYNRQMEEYNRQVAEQEALEAKEAAERAEQERIEAEKAAAEKAEQERIAAEKAAAEKAEADRIAAEKAEAEKAEQERLAAIEKIASDAAKTAAAAEKAAALAAAKLAAAETAMAAAAEAAAAAIAAAEAAGVKPGTAAPKPSVSQETIRAAASQSSLKPAGQPTLKAAGAPPSPTQVLREKSVKATGVANKAPSTSLLRSAVASAAAKSEAKPPATKLLAAAGKAVPKKSLTPALSVAKASPKPTTKLASTASSATKLTKAASTTKLASATSSATKLTKAPNPTKLAKAAPSATKLSRASGTPSKLGGVKKAAPKAAVPAPNAEPAPVEEELAEGIEGVATPEVEPSEEELHARDAYLKALQAGADATPLWKNPMFLIACVVLLLGGGGAAYYVSSVNAAKAAYAKNVEETNRLLRQAGEINKAGADTLADVNKKNIKLECSLADAERLMGVIVDPFQKDENGVNRYGGAPEGVAQNAGLLLGIMAEKEPAIETMIFKSLEQNASKIKPSLFSWMIQRLGVAEVKNINSKLKTLSEKIAAQPKFKTKPKQLSAIWETMGLRISAKDVPVILDILKNEEIDAELVTTLSICLDNIVEMTDDPAQKAKIGDQIFDRVPEKYRKKLIMTLASACSEKALKYYKKRLEEQNNWPTEMNFVAFWGNDDLVDFAIEKHEASKDDTRMNPFAIGAISGIFRQVRDRDQATVDKLMAVLYDKLDEDSSQWQEIINKTDPDAGDFIGKDHADYQGLMDKRADLEASRRQKIGLAKSLGEMRSYPWIDTLLAKLAKDSDEDVARAAEEAQEKIKANTAQYAARKAKYERRSKK